MEKFLFVPKRHPLISHLSDDSLNSLVRDYYAGISISRLFEKYSINTHSKDILHLFPPMILKSECQYCHSNLWQRVSPKSKTSRKNSVYKPYCPRCKHMESEQCRCKNCKNKKVQAINSINSQKKQVQNSPVSIVNMSLWDRICLGTLFQAGFDEIRSLIVIKNSPVSPITSTYSMLDGILNDLLNKGFIENFHSQNSFLMPCNELLFTINNKCIEKETIIDSLISPSVNTDKYSMDELKDCWIKIATDECLAYLNYSLNDVDFPNPVEANAKNLFSDLIRVFSIAQIFGLTSRCLSYATREFQGGRITKKGAASYIIALIRHQGNKAIQNNWNLSSFSRPNEIEESLLFKQFFKVLLRIECDALYLNYKKYFN